MLVRGATAPQIEEARLTVNAEHASKLRFGGSWHYGDGIRPCGKGWRFVLRAEVGVFSRRRPYVRCEHLRHGPIGATACNYGCRPSRMASVCWHGHREFMRALFALAPDARIITGIVTYKGSADFEATHDDTGYQNIGMQCEPVAYREACDCIDSEARADNTYGADEANGAQCAAMTNALRAIQAERKRGSLRPIKG